MSKAGPPRSPYKGLEYYDEKDAQFFFGREAETEIITANLMASRLTLLYGPSGVGKSSVLRAGVMNRLRGAAGRNYAGRGSGLGVVIFDSWREHPLAWLITEIHKATIKKMTPEIQEQLSRPHKLTQAIEMGAERVGGQLVIILDQFEDYFLYHAKEEGDWTFGNELPLVINDPNLRVRFLLSFREDALAKLDRFESSIPKLFDHFLRLEHLDREDARKAIEGPIARYNELLPAGSARVEIEPKLVDEVSDQVKAGKVIVGAGRGVVSSADTAARIETPFLQLVMTRLWEEEARSRSHVLRLATLTRLGGAERIVQTYLDKKLSELPRKEREVAANIFNQLVTPSGTKIAHSVPDLAKYAEMPEPELLRVIEKLAGSDYHVLQTIAPPPEQPGTVRYEIFHDIMAPAILDWRARHLEFMETSKMSRRLGWALFISAPLLFVIMGVLSSSGQGLHTAAAPNGIISLELAGSIEKAQSIITAWSEKQRIRAGVSIGLDYLFLVAYSAAIAFACLLVSNMFRATKPGLAAPGVWLAWGQVVTALSDAIENVALIVMLLGTVEAPWPQVARWFALIKFILVFAGLIYPAIGLIVWAQGRLMDGRRELKAQT